MAERDPFVLRSPEMDDKNGASVHVYPEPATLIPITLPRSFRLESIGVLVLHVVIFIFLIVSLCVPIAIRPPGHGGLTLKAQFLYITGISIGATIASTLGATKLRILFLKRLEGQSSERKLQCANTIIGIDSVGNKLQNWHVSATFLLVGLIAAGMISALTPTYFPLEYPFAASLYPEHVQGSYPDVCFTDGSAGSVSGFTWTMANGSRIGINATTSAECESHRVLPSLDQSSRYILGEDMIYVMGGVPVARSALGAPFRVFDNTFSTAFGIAGYPSQKGFYAELVSASVCLPVIASNPVHCQVAGNVSVSGRNVTVSSNGCTITSPLFSVDPSTQGATVAGACAGVDEGTATLVIGAVNSHTADLATAMGDWQTHHPFYGITCSVDIRPTITIRRLKLYRYSRIFSTAATYRFQFAVASDDSATCEGSIQPSSVSTSTALAVGASASWQLLSEREYKDGRLSTLLGGCWPRVFPGTLHNGCLEETLGLASAMAIGMYWGSVGSSGERSSTPELRSNGVYRLELLRVGPGKWWGIIYTLPLLFSIIVHITLLWRTRHMK